eukprot:4867890-Pyramimonas_sp.AAC.1
MWRQCRRSQPPSDGEERAGGGGRRREEEEKEAEKDWRPQCSIQNEYPTKDGWEKETPRPQGHAGHGVPRPST